MGEYAKALEVLKDSHTRNDEDALVRGLSELFLAMSHWKLGSQEEAQEVFESVTYKPKDAAESTIYETLYKEAEKMLQASASNTGDSD